MHFYTICITSINKCSCKSTNFFRENAEPDTHFIFHERPVYCKRGRDGTARKTNPLLTMHQGGTHGFLAACVGGINEHLIEHVLCKHGIVLRLRCVKPH